MLTESQEPNGQQVQYKTDMKIDKTWTKKKGKKIKTEPTWGPL